MGASNASCSSSSSSSDSNSSSGNSKGRTQGDKWTYKIYFDPEADTNSGASYHIIDDELKNKMARLVDANEQILTISAYKVPLGEWQLTSLTMYH